MTCCSGEGAAAHFFGSRRAERDLRRYQRRGPDASTRMLLTEIRGHPLQDLQLLDVGSGIGVIAAELSTAGLASATLVDASPAYLSVARRHLGSRYGSRPLQFVVGDFTNTGTTLPDADVVTLDRVVCCYPDAESLLTTAAMRARRLMAFSFPRDRWFTRLTTALVNLCFRLARNPFRIFVHSQQRMDSALVDAGMVRAAHQESFLWRFHLYRRASPRNS
jgi:2-polyprenyl-3-methyl-5-hydroxy-6-metoxy-1,4-benzoquinol methylase